MSPSTPLDELSEVSLPDGVLDVSLGILIMSLLPIAAGPTVVFIAAVVSRGVEWPRANEGLV